MKPRFSGDPLLHQSVCSCFIVAVIFSIAAALCGQETAALSDLPTSTPIGREIVVGAYSNTYPYSYQKKPGGEVEGFAVDLLDALARVMNFKIRRVVLPGNEIKARFVAGEFDMLQLFSESKGREEWADYSIPVIHTQNIVLVRKELRSVKTLKDLKGARFVVAGVGSVGDVFLKGHDPSVKITYADSPEHALRLLEEGKGDATILSRLTAGALIEKLKLRDIVELHDPAAYLEHRHRFAVHKGNATLLARLNEGLAILESSGEYDRIYGKWLSRYEHARFTREQVFFYVSAALAVALAVAIWAGLRQRALRRRIARQASDLAEQGELLGALFENVPLGMCVMEFGPENGVHVRSFNRRASEWFDLAASEAIGKSVSELKLKKEWREVYDRVLHHARQLNRIDIAKHTLASSHRHLMITRVPLSPRTSEIQRLCVLIDDVTERWRLDEEIAQGRRLRAIGELVGGIAHEFNNLMTPVMLKVGEVGATHPDDQELQEDMAIVNEAVRRAAALTARLLTFGRKGAGETESLQLSTAIEGAIELLRPTFDRRVVWENCVSADLPPLVFNASDLSQILVNLLLNARDTLMEKLAVKKDVAAWTPRIRIDAAHLPPEHAEKLTAFFDRVLLGWQRLTVSDNGMGISPAVRERIFEPFYTTKTVGQGTGLGLATVWHLVTQAGGRIDLDTTPTEGSTFHVLFPIWAGSVEKADKKHRDDRKPGAPAKILLVEDEEMVAESIEKTLRKLGHQVHWLADGREAWTYLQENLRKHDLLIIDINLPGIDGIDLIRRARRAGYVGRVLVISGRLASSDLTQYPDVAIDGVLPKPFNGEELLAIIEACLTR